MDLGAVLWVAWAAALPSRPQPYTDHMLVEVEVADRAALGRLLASGVDPWLEHPRPGLVPVLVSPERRAMLWADGWTLRVLSVDVQHAVDAEADRLAAQTPVTPGVGDFFADFRDLATIDAELDAMLLASPELVTSYAIGASIEGRTIRAIRVTAAGDDARPAVLITAGQHAREWIAVSSGMYVIDQLVTRAAEPEFAAMLADVQVFVIPVANPDGYAYTWTDERYWRKNRRDGVGVDTNRNFSHSWGGAGSSNVAQDENYAGTAAFSEPETVAIRDFVTAHPELVAHLDVHSFGQLVLYPWGDIDELAPDDDALSATAIVMADEMGLSGTEYTPLQGVHLYPAAGNAIDWSYGDAGLHSLTMELRPDDPEVNFVLPPGQLVPVGDEVLAGLWVLLGVANGVIPDPTDGESSTGGSDASSSSGDDATTQGASTTGVSSTGDAEETGTVDPSASASATLTTNSDVTSASSASSDGGEESTGAAAADGEGGCACTVDAPRPLQSLGCLAAVVFGWRRRRSTGD